MRAMLGDFDFPAFQDAEKHLGPLFFIFYIFIVFFILLNMFLAIINDTYSEVKGEMEMTKIQFEITDLFARGYNNVLGIVLIVKLKVPLKVPPKVEVRSGQTLTQKWDLS